MENDKNLKTEYVIPTFRARSSQTSQTQEAEGESRIFPKVSIRPQEAVSRAKIQFRPHEEEIVQKKSIKPALNKMGQTIPYAYRADRRSIILSGIAMIALLVLVSMILYNKHKLISTVNYAGKTQTSQTGLPDDIALDQAAQESFAIKLKEAEKSEAQINGSVSNSASTNLKEDTVSPEAQSISMAQKMEEIRARQKNPRDSSP